MKCHGRAHIIEYPHQKEKEGYPLGKVRWDTLDHPPPVTSGGDHWRPVQTCSFEDPPLERHLVVATETEVRTVSKYVVYIPLECRFVQLFSNVSFVSTPTDTNFDASYTVTK